MSKLKAIIMAGGTGSRLWPLSRAMHPKQFLALHGEETMLQATMKRISDLDINSSLTICNEEHRFFVAEQLRELGKLDSIILEPDGRNTAPAIALAAMMSEIENDPILLVLAADHIIEDKTSFTEKVKEAIPLAESGNLVTFGIVPHEPNTGYGYIKCGDSIGAGFEVEKFIEKPSAPVAQDFINSDKYLWNSGMFLFKASRYLEELKKYRPNIYEACQLSIENIKRDNDFIRVNEAAFEQCPSESVDYAVMEQTTDAVVVPLEAGWSDIGSWASLWEIAKKDSNGNFSNGDVILHDTNNSYIRTDDKLVTTVGIDDLVILSTKDALLVADKNKVQDVKAIIEQLKNEKRPEWNFHRVVYRPWGKYDSIDTGSEYQVKRITVNPGAKLSVQMHHHRAEHWIVVSGEAKVTVGNRTFILNKNESTYIPLGEVHSLENPGIDKLELIEVQSGSYLGEDDIVRLSDHYGRE
jgi:mannose-1-phosphate guanylyltransferase